MKQTDEQHTVQEQKRHDFSVMRETLRMAHRRVLEQAEMLSRLLYEPTALELYHRMTWERKERAYRRRKTIHERVLEDIRILQLLKEMIREIYAEEREQLNQ